MIAGEPGEAGSYSRTEQLAVRFRPVAQMAPLLTPPNPAAKRTGMGWIARE